MGNLKNDLKVSILKYQSVAYILLFVFQVTFYHSATIQIFSIQSIQHSSSDWNDSEPSSDEEDLIDYENDDSEENEDNEENEEEREVDSEVDCAEDIVASGIYRDDKSNHYKYLSFHSTIKIKEPFSPPEVLY